MLGLEGVELMMREEGWFWTQVKQASGVLRSQRREVECPASQAITSGYSNPHLVSHLPTVSSVHMQL